jgi:hypothetical protein
MKIVRLFYRHINKYLEQRGNRKMNIKSIITASIVTFGSSNVYGAYMGPWINEIHYDNTGADTGEFIEIAGPAQDLTGWEILLYNGSDGTVYDTISLDGLILNDDVNGIGFTAVSTPGIQNGPDGIALVDPFGNIPGYDETPFILDNQFFSYEGSFVATEQAAVGITSIDLGTSEPSDTPVGYSLQLTGTGIKYMDFTTLSYVSSGGDTWTITTPNPSLMAATPGMINTGQTVVPVPAAVWLFGSGLIGLIGIARRKKS